MTTSPVMTITDELLAELSRDAVEHTDWDDEQMMVNPFTILALVEHIRSLTERLEKAEKDAGRLDAIEGNCWDVRYNSSPNGDSGDSSISIEIVGHFMAAPYVRVVGENYHENLRAAIDQAMTADAYPPERPEYADYSAIDREGAEHE